MVLTVELLLMIISILLMGLIFTILYRFRKKPGVIYLLVLVLCRIIYASSIIVEKNSDLLGDLVIFRNVQQTCLILIAALFMLFVQTLTSYPKVIRMRWKLTFLMGFILFIVLIWLDPYIHVVYSDVQAINGKLVVTRTFFSSVFNIVCYSGLTLSLLVLLRYVLTLRSELRKPGVVVLILASIPFVLEIVRFTNPQWSSWIGTFSILCGMTGTIILLVILRTKFFSIVPIAKNVVFDMFEESIIITNATGQVVDGNEKAIHFFSAVGYTDMYGRSIEELLKQWPAWYALAESLHGGSVEIDSWIQDQRRIYRVNVYPIRTTRNHVHGCVSLVVDITEQQMQVEKITQLNKLKDQLFTIVSHDIRSPLAMQSQLVQLLLEDSDPLGAHHQEVITKLSEQINYTLGMTTNLLEWFRGQREDVVLRPRLLDLAEAVEESCRFVQANRLSKSIDIHNEVPNGTYVYADREVVFLVLRNIVSNAVKFTYEGGTVRIRAQLSGKMVIVSVQDDGIGMDAEQVEDLFTESQISSSIGTAGEAGAGLGLLVSKQFVQLSGESIWAESTLGQGSTFYFTMRSGA